MEWIQIIATSAITLVAAVPVINFLLKRAIKKYPEKFSQANQLTGELGEFLVSVAEANADGKVTKDELRAIGKEGVETKDAFINLLGKKAKADK